ncbi:MAG: hypothetical protein NUV57_01375 [archaeon]|nr:hypothetical protein [archaeon]
MLELELVINQLERLYEKEKGIRKKINLETAISALKEYERLNQ